MKTFCSGAVLSLATLLAAAANGRAEDKGWGTIKGRVVFDGAVPERKKVKVDADIAFCTKNGDVLSDELVVDRQTRGVRWAMVWLLDDQGGQKVPIHSSLAKAPPKVVLDQPCCSFEPHALFMRSGQVLEAKNSADVTHNVNILGDGVNAPEKNIAIPPKKSLDFDGWKASPRPVPIQCTIHKWMNCWIRVLDHPYCAVTNEKGEFEIKNAPAGNYRIAVWHESVGWVVKEGGDTGKKGIPVKIEANKTADLSFMLKPEK
jgi:hypothetical protein